MKILLTGGAGYIGTHAAVQFVAAGHSVVLLDSLVNSRPEVVARVERIVGHALAYYAGDCADPKLLDQIFTDHDIDVVVHFAGLKAVGESVEQPLRYYRNNLDCALTLCEAMEARGVRRLVFSSSASVYGAPEQVPIPETASLHAANPYGATKLFVERILADVAVANPAWHIVALRYFNPIGAHPSGLIGEDPRGIPNNLFPYISQVAAGRRDKLRVFGDDYPTPDGTGVRDYLHVMDLADGHVAAVEHIADRVGWRSYNLGTGQGVSVLESVRAFEYATGVHVPYEVAPRRPGDIAECYADPTRAREELGWVAQRTIAEACADAWGWQRANPNGYAAD